MATVGVKGLNNAVMFVCVKKPRRCLEKLIWRRVKGRCAVLGRPSEDVVTPMKLSLLLLDWRLQVCILTYTASDGLAVVRWSPST